MSYGQYVVYSDRYGTQEVFGPFASRDDAEKWMRAGNSNVGDVYQLTTPRKVA